MRVLAYLFGGAILPCRDAADANDDGALDIADAVYVLAYLFAKGTPPPEPSGAPGSDPTTDSIECDAYDVREPWGTLPPVEARSAGNRPADNPCPQARSPGTREPRNNSYLFPVEAFT